MASGQRNWFCCIPVMCESIKFYLRCWICEIVSSLAWSTVTDYWQIL